MPKKRVININVVIDEKGHPWVMGKNIRLLTRWFTALTNEEKIDDESTRRKKRSRK